MNHRIPLTPEQLMAQARELAGVDLIDHEVLEPLTVLHRSLSEEGGLHAQGAMAQQNKLLRLLVNRLYMLRDFAQHPEIREQKIERPLFVIGMGRSGTTKTQKVLAASGDFNFLPFWQTYNWASRTGVPNENVEPRIAEADAYCKWFDERSPETKLGHSFETHEPEEDTTLTEGCLVAPSFVGYSGCASYLQWLGTQDPTRLFRFLREVMQYLQWQWLAEPGKRWLLKAPTYYGFEPFILDVFPDADFVMTHRTPVQTIASACKLVSLFHIPFSDAPVNPDILCAGFSSMMKLHLAHRQSLPNLRILDLSFETVTRDWPSVMEQIYAHAGLPLTDASRQRMAQWGESNPQHKNGGFRYALEDYGLNEARVRAEMGEYMDWMDQKFSK